MSRVCLVVAALFSLTALASAEGIKGDFYYLGIALDNEEAAGNWAQVGANGDWKDTAAGTILNDRLYSVEHAGGLFVTADRSAERHSLASGANSTICLMKSLDCSGRARRGL